jgi:hypothetical protein
VNITFTEPGYLLNLNTDAGLMSGWVYKQSDSWDTHLKITYEWVGEAGQVRHDLRPHIEKLRELFFSSINEADKLPKSSIDEDLNGRFRGSFKNRTIGVDNNEDSVWSACGGGILKAAYRIEMEVPQSPLPEIGIELPLGKPWYIETPMEVLGC